MNDKCVYNKEELEKLDMDIVITRGLLYAYGILELNELFKMVKKYNKNLKKNKLITIIKKEKSICKDFEIKNILTQTGTYECVLYKYLTDEFLEKFEIIFTLKRKKFKKEQILTYSKYGMNIKDKRISELITLLKEYLNDESLQKIMKKVFENLNYNEDLLTTDISLFDELIKSKKYKITGEKYFEIRNALYDILEFCSSWRAAGHDIEKMVEEIKDIEMETMLEELYEPEYFGNDLDCDNNIYDINEDDLPF